MRELEIGRALRSLRTQNLARIRLSNVTTLMEVAMSIINVHSLPFLLRRMLAGSLVMASVLTGWLCGQLAAASLPAKTTVKVGIPFEHRSFKVQNDFVIVWLGSQLSDDTKDRIELFDRFGERLFSVNPIKAIQGAIEMSIWDVGVGSAGLVAVSAVSVDKESNRTGCLMFYSNRGKLLGVYPVQPKQFIRRLVVDEEDNVWGLGEDWSDNEETPVPAVFKYSRGGEFRGRYGPQQGLPPSVTEETGLLGGPESIGLTKDGVWFWLPDRRALVTFQRDGTHVEISPLGTPEWKLPEGANGSTAEVGFGHGYLLPTGKFVVPFAVNSAKGSQSDIYTWEKSKTAWKLLASPEATLPKGGIAGTDGDRVVFALPRSDRHEIEFESVDLP